MSGFDLDEIQRAIELSILEEENRKAELERKRRADNEAAQKRRAEAEAVEKRRAAAAAVAEEERQRRRLEEEALQKAIQLSLAEEETRNRIAAEKAEAEREKWRRSEVAEESRRQALAKEQAELLQAIELSAQHEAKHNAVEDHVLNELRIKQNHEDHARLREEELRMFEQAIALSLADDNVRLEMERMANMMQNEDEIEILPELMKVGKKLVVRLQTILSDNKVKIRFRHRENKISISGADGGLVAYVKNQLLEEYFNSTNPEHCSNKLLAQLAAMRVQRIHIFVDNSNIFGGARMVYNKNANKYVHDPRIRVQADRISRLVTQDRNRVEQRVVFGSTPPRNNVVWKKWEEQKFKVHLYHRAPNTKEQFVDDALISMMQAAILRSGNDSGVPDHRNTLVLLTGDGNRNCGRVTFPQTIEHAINNKWRVELWAWKMTLNRVYLDLLKTYENQ